MQPIHFDGANVFYKAPDGMPECQPMPVLQEGGWCTSVWKIEEDEREALVKLLASGREVCVRVTLAVAHQPVIALTIGTPADGKQTYPSKN
jgi:hypothetical protein